MTNGIDGLRALSISTGALIIIIIVVTFVFMILEKDLRGLVAWALISAVGYIPVKESYDELKKYLSERPTKK